VNEKISLDHKIVVVMILLIVTGCLTAVFVQGNNTECNEKGGRIVNYTNCVDPKGKVIP